MDEQPDERQVAEAASLARELRALVGKLKRRLREQSHVGDLTPSQVSALLRLEKEGPLTSSNLARAEGMRPQSIGPIVAALEAAGLISGVPHQTDGRQTLLSLTDVCRKWIEEGRAARQDWLSRALRTRLSRSEREQLASAVELLKRLVDE